MSEMSDFLMSAAKEPLALTDVEIAKEVQATTPRVGVSAGCNPLERELKAFCLNVLKMHRSELRMGG